MTQVFTVARVVAPILVAIVLGVLAKRSAWLKAEEVRGFQQFVMKIGLPCVVFNSCLTADIGVQSLSSMGVVLATVLIGIAWAFRARKKLFPYHNLPQLFTAQETGMLGIPLFIILFGAGEAYRVGVLDLAQSVVAIPVIAILSANTGENPSTGEIVKKVLISPLAIMSILGLALNISGLGAWLDGIGVGGILTDSTAFLSQPVSAMMIFSVGYNFSLSGGSRRDIFRLSAIHFGMMAVFGVLAQLVLLLVPNVDAATRWALVLYFTLPASYLATSLGRTEEEAAVASGVCSVLTVISLLAFCVMAVFVA